MKIHDVKVVILGEMEGIIHFDDKCYELLASKTYFSTLALPGWPIGFNYMSNRMRTSVMTKRQIFHDIDYDILNTITGPETFMYDNHGKILFVVE